MWNEVLLAIVVLWENKVRTVAPGLLGYMAQYGETRLGLDFCRLDYRDGPADCLLHDLPQ